VGCWPAGLFFFSGAPGRPPPPPPPPPFPENATKMGLQPLPSFLEKAVQLYEMIIVRHGLMLVRILSKRSKDFAFQSICGVSRHFRTICGSPNGLFFCVFANQKVPSKIKNCWFLHEFIKLVKILRTDRKLFIYPQNLLEHYSLL
jgi:hypothetical protein